MAESMLTRMARNPGTKAASALLAVAAWFWVQSQEVDTASVRVALAWRLPDKLVSVTSLPTSAALEVRGSRAAVRRAQRDRPQVLVDLTSEGPGTLDVHLDGYEVSGLPPAVEVGRYRPETLTVRLDEEVLRNVRVDGSWVGEPARGHAIQSAVVQPDVAKIRGARELVSEIDVVNTMPIDVTGWTETRTVPALLDLPRGITVVGEWQGSAQVEVINLLSEITLADVPVRLWNHEVGWRPAEGQETVAITLRGPTRALQEVGTERIVLWVEMPENPRGDSLEAVFEGSDLPRTTIGLRDPRIEIVHAPPTVVLVPR